MKRIVPVLLALALLLSGCALKTGEELYSLPKPPEDYLDLQAALEEQLGRKIHVSPLTQYNGALGAALFAWQKASRDAK